MSVVRLLDTPDYGAERHVERSSILRTRRLVLLHLPLPLVRLALGVLSCEDVHRLRHERSHANAGVDVHVGPVDLGVEDEDEIFPVDSPLPRSPASVVTIGRRRNRSRDLRALAPALAAAVDRTDDLAARTQTPAPSLRLVARLAHRRRRSRHRVQPRVVPHEENLALVRARLVEVHADPGRERRPFLGELVLGVVVRNIRAEVRILGLRPRLFSSSAPDYAGAVGAARRDRPIALVVAAPSPLAERAFDLRGVGVIGGAERVRTDDLRTERGGFRPARLGEVAAPSPELVPLDVRPRVRRGRARMRTEQKRGCVRGMRDGERVRGGSGSGIRAQGAPRAAAAAKKKKREEISRPYVCPGGNGMNIRQRRDARVRLGATRVWNGGGIARGISVGRERTSLLLSATRLRGLVPGVGVEARAFARVRGRIIPEILQHPGDGGVVEGTGARRRVRLLDEPRVRRLGGGARRGEHLLRLHLLQETNLSG